jgi:hypothetical protein
MVTVELYTSIESNRYQHIKWILSYLKFNFNVRSLDQIEKHRLQNASMKIKNPTLYHPDSQKLIQGENAILTWAVLEATKNSNNQNVPS